MTIPYKYRTLSNLILRFFQILKRYGLSTRKIQSNLQLYLDILRQHGITPTFPITAKTLSRHVELIKKFSDSGVEFAVHGYQHKDYTKLSLDTLSQHNHKATKIFKKHNLHFSGFRFPYLRWDKKLLDLIDNHYFTWDSSYSVLWDVFKDIGFKEKNWRIYQTALTQYNFRNSDNFVSLPRFLKNNNILEIPVSLPDDDLLFDRLCLRDEKISTQIWGEILRKSYARGELFTLQLHPERISYFKESLKSLINAANRSRPKIWIASLGDIAEWWNEKGNFSVDINKKGNDEYEVHAHCSRRANILVKTKNFGKGNFFNEYSVIDKNNFTIKSSKRPILGVSRNCSPMLTEFLKNEGFIFEISSDQDRYSVFLNDFDNFDEEDEINVLKEIDRAHSPLIRFWRWPKGFRSSLAITGDIDGLTSVDFFLRVFLR